VGWLLLTYRLPSEGSSARVAVWREVRRSGALHLQQSVVAFPDAEPFTRAVERLRTLVAEVGGETLVVRGEPLAATDDGRLADAWNEARAADYGELVSECEKFLAEIEHEFEIEKFTLAELDEEESALERLQRWHERIAARDVHGAPRADEARAALERASEALARYSTAVFERTQP
jgi:hypothetical protein